MKAVYTQSALANTTTITNIGNIKVEPEYEPYITGFYSFIPMSKGQPIDVYKRQEQIKDEHRESYNMLKAQNVKNLVVCPIRYKDEIRAFSVWIIHRKVILSD